ncbi:MAG: hypothetical protein O3C45_01710 [Bacteroidetes bacterium]|nr:hypothetical protein [Bacteroidota bacterium]
MASSLLKSVLILIALLGTGSALAQPRLAVIVHPDLDRKDVSFMELRRIMRMETQYWRPGETISLILPGPSAPERAPLLDRVYQMSEQAFRQHWIAVAYRAQTLSLPRPYSDCSVAVRIVANLKHAMTVVDAACIGEERVRVLRVDGKLPKDEGYRL